MAAAAAPDSLELEPISARRSSAICATSCRASPSSASRPLQHALRRLAAAAAAAQRLDERRLRRRGDNIEGAVAARVEGDRDGHRHRGQPA